jgi:uncharacterized protein
MRKWPKRIGIGCLGLLLLLFAGIIALLILKPWEVERPVVAPDANGQRLTADGLLGNYYRPPGPPKGAVLVVGGSDGGISETADDMAEAFAEAGYHALVLSYWGAPGQALKMRDLPLETFERGLNWLAKQPEVNGRLAMAGYSKGAEAALLTATHYPALKAVIAGAPSHLSWQGIDVVGTFYDSSSTFSRGGKAVAFMPYRDVNFMAGAGPLEIHTKPLRYQDEYPEAAIKIETIKAPVMLLCGDKDVVWPACLMSEKLLARAKAKQMAEPLFLRYPEAGHGVLGPPITEERPDKLLRRAGGTAEANIAARADAWPKVLAFLEQALNAKQTSSE